MVTKNPWNSQDPAEVAHGGTGNNTFTAYSVLCGGTTSTGPFQNVSGIGTVNQVLMSNGAALLPTWKDASSSINFSARKSANSTNATGDGTAFTLICDTTISNAGSGYNSGTGTFTAPVTGLYMFVALIALGALDAATHTVGLVNFSGHAFDSNPGTMSTSSSNGLSLVYTQFNLLTAGAVSNVSIQVSGGTKTVTVQGGAGASGCFFSGFLVQAS